MKPAPPPQIGSNIQRIRKEQGLTLEVLAERSGVSKAMLSQIESDKVNPTVLTIWKIALGARRRARRYSQRKRGSLASLFGDAAARRGHPRHR